MDHHEQSFCQNKKTKLHMMTEREGLPALLGINKHASADVAPVDAVVYPTAHSWQESAPEAAQEPTGHASHLSENAVLEFE